MSCEITHGLGLQVVFGSLLALLRCWKLVSQTDRLTWPVIRCLKLRARHGIAI